MEPFFRDYLERLHTLDRDFVETFADLPAEALDWVPGADMNSLCVLVVHTTGSARFWIGDGGLGESSNRVRSREFQARGLTHDELKARFSALEDYVAAALERLTPADLAKISSVPHDDEPVTIGWCLLHALEHTGLHLGHAQITRQLWQQK
jgi:hypothetical protein